MSWLGPLVGMGAVGFYLYSAYRQASAEVQTRREQQAGRMVPPGAQRGYSHQGFSSMPPQLQQLFTARDEAELHAMLDQLMASMPPGALGPAGASGLAASALQYRNLTEADYELLSQLDENVRRPASQAITVEQLSCLPIHIHHEKMGNTEAEACSICLDGFAEGAMVTTLPCLHQFHSDCVEPWLKQSGTACSCPVCKAPVFEGQ